MTKTKLFLGVLVGTVSLFMFWLFMSFNGTDVSSAQTSDAEYQKLLERDKTVPKEKVEKAFAEAKKIHDDILGTVAKEMPEFELRRTSAGHVKYGNNPGRRGETRNEIAWQKKNTRISLDFELGFDKQDTLTLFRKGMEGISMGDFIDVPNVGDEATLVKNVSNNIRMTQVGMHFIKGRAQVHIYVSNYKRTTKENERDLMKVVRLVEPLIVARPSFDDL